MRENSEKVTKGESLKKLYSGFRRPGAFIVPPEHEKKRDDWTGLRKTFISGRVPGKCEGREELGGSNL